MSKINNCVIRHLNGEEEKQNTSVAIGYFDGLHLGHINVLKTCLTNPNPIVFTFSSLGMVTKNKHYSGSITNDTDKAKSLLNMGFKRIYMPLFSDICDMSPEDFVTEILIKKLSAKNIYCGEDFKFGKNGIGDVQLLGNICKDYGVTVHVTSLITDNGQKISSSDIKKYLTEGKISTANRLLGYCWNIKGKIIKGNEIGKTIGFPTANVAVDKNLCLPKFGVYATETVIEDKKYLSITNIGTKPTIGEYAPVAETHVIEFTGDIYNKTITIYFKEFIREETKFEDIEILKKTDKK